jgi:predicted HicB family RNase H-like nuclease
MVKREWAQGRKNPTLLVRLDLDVYQGAKEEAKKSKITIKNWVSQVIREKLMKMDH